MRGVFRFTSITHAVAFYGFSKDDRWLPLMFNCGAIRGVNFVRIVTATI